jgi:probable HAF family extracellular repeat protein
MRRSLRKTRLQLETLEDRCVLSSYSMVDLGGFSPSAINGAAQLVGFVGNTSSQSDFPTGQAVLWQNGKLLNLGTLGGSSSAAYGLNDGGQIVGTSTAPSGAYQAFLRDSGGMHNLGLAGSATAAYGINASAQVVGTIGLNTYTPHTFLWDSAHGLQDLGTVAGYPATGSQARAINRTGQIVGWVEERNAGGMGVYYSSMNGYVLDSTTGTVRGLRALPGYVASQATGINDAGQVIGTCGGFIGMPHFNLYSPREGFLWQDGVMTDLGMPSASGINDLGQVVGGKYLWQNGTLTDLNTLIDPASGWVITSTSDINDNGQIVGQGTLDGQGHCFLMDPVDPSGTASFSVNGFASPTTAGATGSFTTTALDSSGAPATGYTGTVYFTSSDPQASLPSAYTFTMADAGVHTFSATLKTAGTQSITVTDAAHGTSGTQDGITVQPAALSKLAVAGFPSSITAGVAGYLTVRAQDAYGNTVSSYVGTVSFSSSDAKAVLPANYTFTVDDTGVHSFGATLKTAGTQSIMAADIAMAGLAGADAGLQVNPAAASRLAISGPATVTAGAAFSITVTAYDAYGNVATGYLGTVAFKSSNTSAILPATYTFTTTDKGVHTFTGLKLKKKGTQTITITDTLNALLTATLSISVN